MTTNTGMTEKPEKPQKPEAKQKPPVRGRIYSAEEIDKWTVVGVGNCPGNSWPGRRNDEVVRLPDGTIRYPMRGVE